MVYCPLYLITAKKNFQLLFYFGCTFRIFRHMRSVHLHVYHEKKKSGEEIKTEMT